MHAILIPYEITALSSVLGFWWDNVPLAAVCGICIVLYACVSSEFLYSRKANTIVRLINIFAVKWYGEAEFWLSIGKILLIFIVYGFTFVTVLSFRRAVLSKQESLTLSTAF